MIFVSKHENEAKTSEATIDEIHQVRIMQPKKFNCVQLHKKIVALKMLRQIPALISLPKKQKPWKT